MQAIAANPYFGVRVSDELDTFGKTSLVMLIMSGLVWVVQKLWVKGDNSLNSSIANMAAALTTIQQQLSSIEKQALMDKTEVRIVQEQVKNLERDFGELRRTLQTYHDRLDGKGRPNYRDDGED